MVMKFGQGVIESDWVRLIEFIWRFISSSKQGFRTTTTDSQCSEVTFANREWVCFTICHQAMEISCFPSKKW